jgi:hypothetical protein
VLSWRNNLRKRKKKYSPTLKWSWQLYDNSAANWYNLLNCVCYSVFCSSLCSYNQIPPPITFQLLCKDRTTRPNALALSVQPLSGSHQRSPRLQAHSAYELPDQFMPLLNYTWRRKQNLCDRGSIPCRSYAQNNPYVPVRFLFRE